MTTTADTLFGGRYRLVQRIARGGMGEVWRATDELLQRPVAVKLLREDLVGDPGFIGRFRAEARHTALLSHPGIAQLHDYGEQGGRAYLVMELVPGDPLSWILARDGALEPERALRYIGQAALALQVAHDARVIHRDVKPANLIITPNEQVKITDFGIAKAIGDGTLTGTGQVMGTAEYLSPEQAIGRDATPLSDIYALGIVLYECLAGQRPFLDGNPVAIALAQVHEHPPPLPESVPAPVQDLVGRLLAKDPAARPAGGGALAREIAALLSAAATDQGHLQPRGSAQAALVPSGLRGDGLSTQRAAIRRAPLIVGSSPESSPESGPASSDATVVSAPVSDRPDNIPANTPAYGSRNGPAVRVPAASGPSDSDATNVIVANAEDDSTEQFVRANRTDQASPAARTARLQDLTARPTGRRRAPRRNGVDLDRAKAAVSAATRKNRAVIVIGAAVAFCAALVGFALGQGQDREPDPPTGITIPRVVDRPAADAIQVLEAAGLHVLVTYRVSDSAEPDTVVEQDPPAGVTVQDGTVAQITVASGQAQSLDAPGDAAIVTNVDFLGASYRAETDAAPKFAAIAGTVADVVQANRAVGDPRPRSRPSNPGWTAI